MRVSVVVPCFRSTATLPALVERLAQVLPAHTEAHEVILVVDDGEDTTWAVAAAQARRLAEVRAIRLARNYGQHNALVAGVRAARHETVVTMDDDLQHPPEAVPTLLAALSSRVDLVYGVPEREEHGPVRSLASRVAKRGIAATLRVRNARDLSAFRAFRSYLCGAFDQIAGPHASVDVALSWATDRSVAVTVPMNARATGRSGYTLRGLLRHTANMVLGYSTAPLRAVMALGFAVGVVGLGFAGLTAYQYFSGVTRVAGFTTVASLVAIFASVQLIALGVLGEYVGRIHTDRMGRPTYLIRECVGEPDPDGAAHAARAARPSPAGQRG
ncbi:glucosyl transferase [Pilimelia terevasa]|uniref:Glucosyl transferase n=1 Tax=Pilimelia terevasa TaxID=53372 RepID=A0A8J3FJL1_9ACTN|nr:glycosyltransferase family 2 protein [Pilimelia terevasa]GGK40935.1 glucosyl transferase [Pilimelia terevasa]